MDEKIFHLLEVIENQNNHIIGVVEKIKKTVDRIEQDIDFDRKDNSESSNRMLHMEAEFKTLRETIFNLSGDTKKKIKDVIEPMKESTDNLTEAIADKKVVMLKENKIKKPFWLFRMFKR